jgi:hypothetical protein
VYTVDPEDLQPCDCNPLKPNPCGEESNCLNRMLMFECHMQASTLAPERPESRVADPHSFDPDPWF